MSADAKSSVMPIPPAQQFSQNPFSAAQNGSEEIEASELEAPIRAIGHRATDDPNGGGRLGERFEEDTVTMLLFARGAVILLTAPVMRGQELMVINKRTHRYAHCCVTNLRTTPDVNYVEIEFTHDIPDFWGISFPRDAAGAVSAVAAFAGQISAEPQTNERVEGPVPGPAKALAAAACIGAANAGAAETVPALESAVTTITSRPIPLEETDERPSPAPFFALRPMECVPVCEPVTDPLEGPPSDFVEAEAVPRLMSGEPLFTLAPRAKRRRLVATAVLGLCTMILGYLFFSPPEEAASSDLESAVPSPGDAKPGAGLAAVPARTLNGEEASSVVVVAAPEPEIETVDAPKQRVVLVSSMTMPVKNVSKPPNDAPELSANASEEPAAGIPGKAEGLLGAARPAPPPPQEEPPANSEKPAQTLTAARLVTTVRPIYPPAAKQAQIQGNVVMEIEIDASGNVTESKVLSGPQALRAAATAAVAKWKYEPALLGDRPTASSSIVMVTFQLR